MTDLKYTHVGLGWQPLVKPLEELCIANGVKVRQVKEKFGTLRIHVDHIDDEELSDKVYRMIKSAEHLANITCEMCGEYGEHGGKYWLKTYCQKHHDEENKRLED